MPMAEVFYTDPQVDMHNRMKEALVLLGKLPRAVVRPPLVKITPEEIERIRCALIAAGDVARGEGAPPGLTAHGAHTEKHSRGAGLLFCSC